MNLSTFDLIIVVIPAFLVLGVAFVMRRYLRSVADFLAASRCAGRYLLATATGETGAAIMVTVAAMETFSKVGWSLGFWGNFTSAILFMLTLVGFVSYRFRETRALTFHQFFEVRYSKNLRGFASFLNVFSGLFNFGLAPGIMARFFVYFCNLPPVAFSLPTPWGEMDIPTTVVVMLGFIFLALFMTLTGGQISIMVTDCLEGIISMIFYVIVAIALFFFILNKDQMQRVMLSGSEGKSYVNPFDIYNQPDFNGWYIAIGFFVTLMIYRGNAWNAGFAAAAKNAHENKMAGILGMWRGTAGLVMGSLISVGAFTLLHSEDYASQQQIVEQTIQTIPEEQIRTQMTMPVALSQLLPTGIKGCFLAIAIFGTLAGLGAQMHSFGSTFLQDVILPFKKKALSPRVHILALQLCALGVGLFGIFFSIIYKPPEYLVMLTGLIGAIYLGGIGSCVLGGLYWRRGTTQGAWAALIVGSVFAFTNWMILNLWPQIDRSLILWINPDLTAVYPWESVLKNATHMPWINTTLAAVCHPMPYKTWAFSGLHPWWGHDLTSLFSFLLKHQDRSPLNAQILAFISYLAAACAYVVVSLLTCKEKFDMDRMLHRGKYKIDATTEVNVLPPGKKWTWGALIGIDQYYTRGDKIIAIGTFYWNIFWKVAATIILLWNLFLSRWSDVWWFNWTYYIGIYLQLGIGVITAIWFTIGASMDLVKLFSSLRTVQRNDADDGTVRNHHNVGEPATGSDK